MKMTKITAYINDGDMWHHQALYLAVLQMLHENGIAGGTVLHAVAGFTNKGAVNTTTLVDVGGKLPLVIQFIDTHEKVKSVLPDLVTMVGTRLVISEEVQVINYS